VVAGTIHGMLFQGALSMVHPLSERLRQAALVSALVFALILPVAGLLAVVPILIVQKVANRFTIGGFWFYVICGGLAGAASNVLVVIIGMRIFADLPPQPELAERVANTALFFIPSGMLGGLIYWSISGRRSGGPASPSARDPAAAP
jgi:hypothetical protein